MDPMDESQTTGGLQVGVGTAINTGYHRVILRRACAPTNGCYPSPVRYRRTPRQFAAKNHTGSMGASRNAPTLAQLIEKPRRQTIGHHTMMRQLRAATRSRIEKATRWTG